MHVKTGIVTLALVLGATAAGSGQQTPQGATPRTPNGTKPPVAAPKGVDATADYVIGPEDVLTVVFWREAEVSGDVVVRPDGMISIPLLQDVQAAGSTPEQLAARLTELGQKLFQNPSVTVTVKQILSRKVFITGNVMKPGSYPLTSPTTVLQLIALAGGLTEFADEKNISIMRNEGGKATSFRFNYKDVSKRKNLQQNILLKPGDTIVVP